MRKVILISLAVMLGGCEVYSDPSTGAAKAVPAWQYVNPDSMVPPNHK